MQEEVLHYLHTMLPQLGAPLVTAHDLKPRLYLYPMRHAAEIINVLSNAEPPYMTAEQAQEAYRTFDLTPTKLAIPRATATAMAASGPAR